MKQLNKKMKDPKKIPAWMGRNFTAVSLFLSLLLFVPYKSISTMLQPSMELLRKQALREVASKVYAPASSGPLTQPHIQKARSESGIATLEYATPVYTLDVPGVHAMLQFPKKPKGLLFLAHGCGQSALNHWKPSDSCPHCVGLPEDVNITVRALARGYAVVAVSSQSMATSGCWEIHRPPSSTTDQKKVVEVLKLLNSNAWPTLKGLPQYALGASMGGSLVLHLALVHPFQAVAAQIMAVDPEALKIAPAPAGRKYPPTMFIHMPRDQGTAGMVHVDMEILKKQGTEVKEVVVEPRPVTDELLQQKLGVRTFTAQRLLQVLERAKVLDTNGTFLADPRSVYWQATLEEEMGEFRPKNLQPRQLAEVLNLAYAGHEIVSDTTDLMLDWFEAQAASTPTTIPNMAPRPFLQRHF